ncbi:formimidoylglutamase [Achromobacter sp. Marseille-Q0513]|uniref:formimidoylglutamase n=1 Tax=Achromobacter sp. Marseille-Q0513 TaxID=2829161 RepID=UPI001B9A69B2|nr:formimidoylglutamase [Achromobacter sp. Marseille-Q0513]MBR8655526.1 formimidoylglutamase [Achromobacter sp. Marseille-Q0513]
MSTPQLDASVWVARDDSAERGDTRRLAHIVRAYDGQAEAGEGVLLGFACDAGVARNQGRVGAAAGPAGIRKFLAGLPAHGLTRLLDAGDVACEGDALEAAQDALGQRVAALLGQGARPLVLGGGHEIAWGSFQGLARWLESRGDDGAVLVLNLDAHFDLRTGRPGSSGTPFDQIASYCQERGRKLQYACLGVSRLANTPALFARADEVGAVWVEDRDMGERHLQARLEQLDGLLAAASHVYLTIDLDVLPAAVMPGVSAPAPYGVPMAVVEEIALRVKASGKLRLADMAEYNPRFDVDGHGARAAARLAWQLLSA